MKLIKILLLSLSLSITHLSFSQSSLLWKVEGNNLQKPVYLFGTVHLIPAAKFKVSPALDSISKNVDRIVFEMDLAHPDLAAITMKKLLLDSVKSIQELYSAKEYKKLTKKLEKHNIPYKLFEKFKPFMLQQQAMQVLLVENPKGYESHFLQIAKSKKIATGGLDAPEIQLATLDSIPLKKQAQSLYDIVMKPENSRKEIEKLFEMYQTNDVEVIYNYIMNVPDFSSISSPLLDVRNIRWIENLQEMFKKNEALLVAVGAAHLGGPKGMIKLLQEKGYTLTPVKNE